MLARRVMLEEPSSTSARTARKAICERGRSSRDAWHQQVTRADVSFPKFSRRPAADLIVVDDDPEGFRDIAHAYTPFRKQEEG